MAWVVVSAVVLAGLAPIVGLVWSFRREWRGEWRGHTIRYVNRVIDERLYIDGVLVASAGGANRPEARIEASIPGSVRGERVVGVITLSGLSLRGSLYVDGVWCGGDRPPEVAEGVAPATGPTPRDARWPGLVARIAAVPDSVAPAAARLRAAAYQALIDLEDAAFAGDEDPAARARVEALVQEAASLPVRERRLLAGHGAEDVLAEVRAAVEVERLGRPDSREGREG